MSAREPVFDEEGNEQHAEGYDSLPRINTAQGPRPTRTNHSRGVKSAQNLGQQQRPIVRQAENLDENRVVLYKRSKQLGQGYFVVEISSNNSHLFVSAHDVESPESFLIELPEKRAQDILKEF